MAGYRLRSVTILLAFLSACRAIPAQPQSAGTVATVRFQIAIVNTLEGRRAAMHLQEQMAPQLAALEKKKADIEEMRWKLDQESKRRHGIWPFRRRMSRRRKAMLEAEIARMAKAAQRERDDDRAALEKERLRIMNELGNRMKTVLEKYARDHGYCIILDSGSPQSHILVSKNDLTDEIVRLYDLTYPAQP